MIWKTLPLKLSLWKQLIPLAVKDTSKCQRFKTGEIRTWKGLFAPGTGEDFRFFNWFVSQLPPLLQAVGKKMPWGTKEQKFYCKISSVTQRKFAVPFFYMLINILLNCYSFSLDITDYSRPGLQSLDISSLRQWFLWCYTPVQKNYFSKKLPQHYICTLWTSNNIMGFRKCLKTTNTAFSFRVCRERSGLMDGSIKHTISKMNMLHLFFYIFVIIAYFRCSFSTPSDG